jgi:hypothetical protein
MAEYKVIQDVEAEDKLIGPLTMKQFIFAGVAAGFGFVGFLVASKTNFLALIPFLPFIIIPGVLAAPFGKDQPTDIWLAAKIRFLIKPRKRIWDQSGIKELVHITVPKKITNNLSQQEVKSHLKALADVIDSHGWAVKSDDINLFTVPSFEAADSDRLIDVSSMPQAVPDIDITAADDIMDVQNNNIAQHFDSMVKASTVNQRQSAIDHMKLAVKNANTSTSSTPQKDKLSSPTTKMFNEQIVMPHQPQPATNEPLNNEDLLLIRQIEHSQLQSDEISKMISPKHKFITPTEEPATNESYQTTAVTPPKNPDIVNLANTDFKVATIAGLANRKNPVSSGEVVVNLH